MRLGVGAGLAEQFLGARGRGLEAFGGVAVGDVEQGLGLGLEAFRLRLEALGLGPQPLRLRVVALGLRGGLGAQAGDLGLGLAQQLRGVGGGALGALGGLAGDALRLGDRLAPDALGLRTGLDDEAFRLAAGAGLDLLDLGADRLGALLRDGEHAVGLGLRAGQDGVGLGPGGLRDAAGLVACGGGLGGRVGEQALGLGAGALDELARAFVGLLAYLFGPGDVLADPGLGGLPGVRELFLHAPAAGLELGLPLRLVLGGPLRGLLHDALRVRARFRQFSFGVGTDLFGLELGVAQHLLGLAADAAELRGGKLPSEVMQLRAKDLDLISEVFRVRDAFLALSLQPLHLGFDLAEAVVNLVTVVVAPHCGVPLHPLAASSPAPSPYPNLTPGLSARWALTSPDSPWIRQILSETVGTRPLLPVGTGQAATVVPTARVTVSTREMVSDPGKA